MEYPMMRFLLAGCVAMLTLPAAAFAGDCRVCGPAPTPYATTYWAPGPFCYGSWSGPYCYPAAQWRPSLPPPPCAPRCCAAGCHDTASIPAPTAPERLPMPRPADEQ